MLEVFNPTQGPSKKTTKMAARCQSLDGVTLGVIYNGRPVGDAILEKLLETLRRKCQLKEVVYRSKTFVGNIVPAEIAEELTGKCQAVITGVGD